MFMFMLMFLSMLMFASNYHPSVSRDTADCFSDFGQCFSLSHPVFFSNLLFSPGFNTSVVVGLATAAF